MAMERENKNKEAGKFPIDRRYTHPHTTFTLPIPRSPSVKDSTSHQCHSHAYVRVLALSRYLSFILGSYRSSPPCPSPPYAPFSTHKFPFLPCTLPQARFRIASPPLPVTLTHSPSPFSIPHGMMIMMMIVFTSGGIFIKYRPDKAYYTPF